MKVLQVYCSYSRGGGEIATIELSAGLKNKGIDVILACPDGSFLQKKAQENAILNEPLNICTSIDFFGVLELKKILRKHKIDILHIQQGGLLWPSAVIKKFSFPQIKLILHRRTMTPIKKSSLWAVNTCDTIIADSIAVKNVLTSTRQIAEEKIVVIYQGIDTKKFTPEYVTKQRKILGLGKSFVIGTAGAMIPPFGKGQEYLIIAIKELISHGIDVKGLIIGEGPMQPYFKKFVDRLGLTEKVIFADYKEDINEYISAMDIFCLLSYGGESFGRVLIEAQAMGKPVIGTNVGGIPEAIDEGKTGYIIPPKDTTRLVEKVLEFVHQPERLTTFGKNAVTWVSKNFTIDNMLDKTISLYAKIMADVVCT